MITKREAIPLLIDRLRADAEFDVREPGIKDFLESVHCFWNYDGADSGVFSLFWAKRYDKKARITKASVLFLDQAPGVPDRGRST